MLDRIRVTMLMSGGMDSTVLCHFLAQRYTVRPIFVDYGQRAIAAERIAAQRITAAFGLPLREVHFTCGVNFGSGEIRGRNLFLLTAALMSLPPDHNLIAIGIHAGTHYYDCSETFIKRVDQLVAEYTDGKVSVIAPFADWHKSDIFSYAVTHSLPIALTYSCESGEDNGCGKCNSCLDREALGVS